MKKYLVAIFVSFVIAQTSSSQPYMMKNLGVEDGLSNNYVKDIVQDRQGFIWIATESGLNRFDGHSFTRYTASNSGLQKDAINSLLYDPIDNFLWIGNNTSLSVLDCSTYQFTNYDSIAGIPISNIIHISHADNNAIWITDLDNGAIRYDKQTKLFTHLKQEEVENSTICIFDDAKGRLYIGHAQKGLTIVDRNDNTIQNFRYEPNNPKSLPGNTVYSIYMDHHQNIWIGTNQGLALLNQRRDDFLVFKHDPANPYSLISDHIYCIREMKDGTLWIGSDIGGVSILDLYEMGYANPETVKFLNLTSMSEKDELSSGNIRSLLQDSFGNIWIGNYSSGLDFISYTQPPFQILPYMTLKYNRLKNKPVWGIYADSKQQIWVGGENELSCFKDNKLYTTIDISPYQSRPYTQIFSMIGNNKGSILLGLYDDGLLEFNTGTKKIHRIDLGREHVDVISFYEDKTSRIWIGTEYGLYSYFEGNVRKEEVISRQIHNQSVYGILHDKQGKLWVASYWGGVYIFDPDQKLTHKLDLDNGFFSNSINHLYQDSEGGVWIATRNGLGYIADTTQPNQYEHYGTEHGITDVFVRSVQEDLSGNIWLSTNQGISLWDKTEKRFKNYNYVDGIPLGNFIEGSSCITAEGTVYFGSLNGACYFNPQEVMTEHPVAPVQLIECKGFDKEKEYLLPITDDVSLEHRQNTIRISFSVPDYSQNQLVEYAYKLEGLEDSWINISSENYVTFRSISPGNYTFKVKARLKNQQWDEKHIASMKIQINPPLWLTWYAKLLYLCVICVGIYATVRFYKNKLELKSILEIERQNSRNEQNLNQERLRFYTNITHELRTPLTLILGPLEDLAYDKELPAHYSKKINTIHKSAIRLLNLINQILEFRKTETQNRKLTVAKGNPADLITEIGLRYKELNRNERLEFIIRIDTNLTDVYFDADIISTILNNLLSNAIKYTPEGKIELILSTRNESDKEYIEFKITDTGYGIKPEALPHIFDRYYQAKENHQASGTGIGLALVKSLAELHEGEIDVTSIPGKGTSFTFRILAQNTYPDALHKDIQIPVQEPRFITEEKTPDTDPVMLIVEDNSDIREYITSSFPEYKIIEASDGKQGLEQAFKEIPNIIISDIMMPGMDGIEFCRIVKEDMRTSHIPVILLTAKDTIQDKEEGYESGADSYLTKPFSVRLLRSRIQNLLESRKKLAQQIASQAQGLKMQSAQETVKMSRLDEEFLEKLTKIIEENLDIDKLDIEFITSRMNMSHSTFYRKVKGLTGMPSNLFIRKIKLKNSAKLLLSGDYNVSEAAYMTGFNNLGAFREAFKEEYGLSPSEFLKQNNVRGI